MGENPCFVQTTPREGPTIWWSTETHTFMRNWEEFIPTLEDVICLTSFVIWQLKSHGNQFGWGQLKYLVATMTTSRLSSDSTFVTWLQVFDKEDGNHSEFVVEAFLACWLSCISCPTDRGWLNQYVFHLAIQIAKCMQFLFAPLFRRSFYAWLDYFIGNVFLGNG